MKKSEPFTSIYVHLSFKGNCREAMHFYQQCLGGKLHLQEVGESPMAEQWPLNKQKHILHAELRGDRMVLLGSDMGEESLHAAGGPVSLALVCTSKRQIEEVFPLLAVGGTVTHPLHHFFDGTIGALRDRFGVNWIIKF